MSVNFTMIHPSLSPLADGETLVNKFLSRTCVI